MQLNLNLELTAPVEIFQGESGQWIGHCPVFDVASQGDSPEEAKRMLAEALTAFIKMCYEMGTLDEVLNSPNPDTPEPEGPFGVGAIRPLSPRSSTGICAGGISVTGPTPILTAKPTGSFIFSRNGATNGLFLRTCGHRRARRPRTGAKSRRAGKGKDWNFVHFFEWVR